MVGTYFFGDNNCTLYMLQLHLHRVMFLCRQNRVTITLPAENKICTQNFFSDPYALFSPANENKSPDDFELAYYHNGNECSTINVPTWGNHFIIRTNFPVKFKPIMSRIGPSRQGLSFLALIEQTEVPNLLLNAALSHPHAFSSILRCKYVLAGCTLKALCNCSRVFIYAMRITNEIVIAGNEGNSKIHKYVCGELQKKHGVSIK